MSEIRKLPNEPNWGCQYTDAKNDRVARYAARLRSQLASLDALERHALLIREQEKWLNRYRTFTAAVDRGEEPPVGITASDYILTLCAINSHLMDHL